jgi:hypothetical protein
MVVVEVMVGAICGHVGECDEDRFVDRVGVTWAGRLIS